MQGGRVSGLPQVSFDPGVALLEIYPVGILAGLIVI